MVEESGSEQNIPQKGKFGLVVIIILVLLILVSVILYLFVFSANPKVQITCTDSDGGINIMEVGKVTLINGSLKNLSLADLKIDKEGIKTETMFDGSSISSASDSCGDKPIGNEPGKSYVKEFFCMNISNSNVSIKFYESGCPAGTTCQYGACSNKTYLIEKDIGKLKYLKTSNEPAIYTADYSGNLNPLEVQIGLIGSSGLNKNWCDGVKKVLKEDKNIKTILIDNNLLYQQNNLVFWISNFTCIQIINDDSIEVTKEYLKLYPSNLFS